MIYCKKNFFNNEVDKSSFFHEEKNYTDSSASFFEDEFPIMINENRKLSHFLNQRLENFCALIDNRLNYVESLHNLPDNWISGNAQKPNSETIKKGKDLLKCFQRYICRKESEQTLCVSHQSESHDQSFYHVGDPLDCVPIPKLVMGPMPSGGLVVEFHVDEDNAMYVTIENESENISLEFQKNGYFFDSELKSDQGLKGVMDGITGLSRG